MADKSSIEWTDATWTPIRARVWEIQDEGAGKERIGWHCEHVSEGCRICYAERLNRRLGTGHDFKPGELYREEKRGYNNGDVKLFLDEKMLTAPLRWKKPRMIFVCSMTDLFADFVPDEWIDKVFAVMGLAPQHTFQVLTKRAKRMREYFEKIERELREAGEQDYAPRRLDQLACDLSGSPCAAGYMEEVDWPLPNVWLGVSAERQQEANERIPALLMTPASVRFVSAEPLLGNIDFKAIRYEDEDAEIRVNALDAEAWVENSESASAYSNDADGVTGLDWIIVGGESGHDARPMHPAWARSIRDQCQAAHVPFFFKQWGAWGRAAPRPSGTPGNFAIANAPPYSDFWPALVTETDQYPRQFDLFGGATVLERLGKKAAGRLLDGVEHNGMPELREVSAL